jgi:hypothetical protein
VLFSALLFLLFLGIRFSPLSQNPQYMRIHGTPPAWLGIKLGNSLDRYSFLSGRKDTPFLPLPEKKKKKEKEKEKVTHPIVGVYEQGWRG